MKKMHRIPRALRLFATCTAFAGMVSAGGQTLRRLAAVPAAGADRVTMDAAVSGRVSSSTTLGHLAGTVQLHAMALVLQPTAAQDAALTQLLADQQNPSSASYHKWLTPAQYGASFGLSDADLGVLESWLQAQGFTVNEVAPSRNRIVFSGAATTVEAAFGTTLQRYSNGTQNFFENSTPLQIPAAFAGVVSGVSGLSSYHLLPPAAKHLSQVTPAYTSSTGKHYLVPWDVRQIFGSNTLINSGYDGTGIKVAVLGQSSISTTQLSDFQAKTGATAKLPTLVIVPGTGTSGVLSTGDEGESELDLEQVNGGAPGATVIFVYTGLGDSTNGTDGNNNGVFDSLAYAVTNNLAPIMTLSYGECETGDKTFINSVMEPYLKQANSQGQTFFASSGDDGSASCETASAPTVATGGLSVSYPASSAYATGVGGTQLTSDASTYWSSSDNSYQGSAIGYVPEVAWNDTASYGSLASSGGGYSALFGKPSWQVGTGVPADGHRDVPDVAMPAGVEENAYIICSANSVCTNTTPGFVTGGGGLVGGTSAASPNWAAALAIIEQANGGGSLGNINTSLYSLAQTSAYTTLFHDTTSGTNTVTCRGGTLGCSSTVSTTNGTMGYTAGTGYDEVTGLGSPVVPALQAALKALGTTTTLLTPSVTLTASSTSPTISTSVTFTAAVAGSGATPTGTVTFAVDGTTVGSAVTLASGTASYVYSAGFTTAGTHTVVASYSGDGVYSGGSSTISITAVGGSGSGTAGITLAASPTTLTVAAGSSGNETLTVTSTNSYTGTVGFTASLVSTTGSTFAGCYALSSSTVSPAANSTASTTMVVYTASSSCTGANVVRLSSSAASLAVPSMTNTGGGFGRTSLAILSAGLLGCFAFRRRLRVGGLMAIVGFALAMGLSGCSTSGTTTTTTTGKGTYIIQVVGTSTTTSTVTSTAQFTLVVD